MMRKSILITFMLLVFVLIASGASAKLSITSYCDVTKEACKSQDQALLLIENKYYHDADVDYRYYFDLDDPKAAMAHVALDCAAKQDAFDSYKAHLQENLDDLSRDALKGYAQDIGLVYANFTLCLDIQATAPGVLVEVEQSMEDGVSVAPTVVFNYDTYTGSQTFTSLEVLVKQYLGLGIAQEPSYPTEVEDEMVPEVIPTEVVPAPTDDVMVDEPVEEEPQKVLFFRVMDDIGAWWMGLFGR